MYLVISEDGKILPKALLAVSCLRSGGYQAIIAGPYGLLTGNHNKRKCTILIFRRTLAPVGTEFGLNPGGAFPKILAPANGADSIEPTLANTVTDLHMMQRKMQR